VLDKASVKDGKTAMLRKNFTKLGLTSALIIDGAQIEANFALAARNIPNIDVLPVQGINVYDILRRHRLVLTKSALEALEARFK
jgi:large subunit ribosomal protein L4